MDLKYTDTPLHPLLRKFAALAIHSACISLFSEEED